MREILIIKPSSLGDIVHGLIVAQSIKAQEPDARITWIARDRFAPIVEQATCVDKVIVFNRKGGLKGFLKMIGEIRAVKYDIVLDMQSLLRTGLMTFFARGKVKIGRRDAGEGSGIFYNKRVNFPANSIHAVDVLMQFLPAIGLKPEYAPVQFRRYGTTTLPTGSVLIFPSSRGGPKIWPFFKELTLELQKAGVKNIVWSSDQKLDVPAGVIDGTGRPDLPEIPTFVTQAALLIANDSGPMHIAAAAGIPTLGLFGPTSPDRFAPYPRDAARNQVIVSSSGAMKDLPVEVVLKAALGMLSSQPVTK